MNYYYHISFTFQNDIGTGNGDMQLSRMTKFRTGEDIAILRKDIELNNKVKNVTVINIVLLDTELLREEGM